MTNQLIAENYFTYFNETRDIFISLADEGMRLGEIFARKNNISFKKLHEIIDTYFKNLSD